MDDKENIPDFSQESAQYILEAEQKSSLLDQLLHQPKLRKYLYPHLYRGTFDFMPRRADGTFASKTAQKESDGVWENVARHCLLTSLVTDVLAEALDLSAQQRRQVNLAALIHDSGKKTERMWQQAIQNGFGDLQAGTTINTHEEMLQVALEDIKRMEEWENAELGISPEITRLSHANIPPSERGHSTILGKIVWLADACVNDVNIVSIAQRFEHLLQGAEIPKERLETNYSFSESFRTVYSGKSLYEVQIKLGEDYIKQFTERIHGVEGENFYQWLQDRVDQRLQAQKLPLL